jgi:hypothetical protein
MYKGMLDNPELVRRLAKTDDGAGVGGAGAGVGGAGAGVGGAGAGAVTSTAVEDDGDSENDLPRQFPLKRISSLGSSPPLRSITAATTSIPIDSLVDNNIDTIFVKITDLYSQEDYTIIYHTLIKIQADPQYYMNYIEGLNKILEPVNIRIKKWIDDNIVF